MLLLLLALLENKLNKNLPERNFVSRSIGSSISDEARKEKTPLKTCTKFNFFSYNNNNNHKLGAAAGVDCDCDSDAGS